MTNFRIHIQKYLEASPSLKAFLEETFVKQYRNRRKLFLKASEIDPCLIPKQPDFIFNQALDENWLPQFN